MGSRLHSVFWRGHSPGGQLNLKSFGRIQLGAIVRLARQLFWYSSSTSTVFSTAMSAQKYLCLALFAMIGCSDHHSKETVVVQAVPRPVALEVEVYDPATNFVWENVAVRIVQADVTGAGGAFDNIIPDDWYFTDQSGLVFFDSAVFANAQVGFLIDNTGQAVLDFGEEARVVIEVDALGFTAVVVEVTLTWDQPQLFVSVPFN